jgi:hypothetical protein
VLRYACVAEATGETLLAAWYVVHVLCPNCFRPYCALIDIGSATRRGEAMYEVILGPAAERAFKELGTSSGRAMLKTALQTELIDGPNAAYRHEFEIGSDYNKNPYRGLAYSALPLSFGGYTAVYRSMSSEELMRLKVEQGRSVSDCGFYVADILPAESAFSRPKPSGRG